MLINDCYECRRLGYDYYIDADGEWASECDGCQNNGSMKRQAGMPDKKKVIKGLEETCTMIEDYLPSHDVGYARMACRDAIDLLQEQETVEPFHKCSGFSNEYELIADQRFNFCPYCGRKVKWNANN